MKISQVLESQQQLDELNLAQAGQAVGGAVGKTANAIGGIAGGVKGAWDAAKSGFQAGKDFVGGQKVGATDAKSINQQGPAGTAPAQNIQGSAGTAMGNMGKAMAGQKPAQAGATLYAQVKSQINKLDPQSKQKLLTLVQKSVQQKQPKQGGQQAPAQPNTMANAPVSATNTAKPGNPNAQQATTPPEEQPAAPAQQTAAPAEQPAQQKMDPNKAAELKGRLKAGQGVGQTAGGGFKNYVAGSQEKFQGADASGAPVFKKLQREGAYGFESKFFGGLI